MIAIINTGETNEAGEHRYRLQINDRVIGEFHHHRPDGLATCLRRAAMAAQVAHDKEAEALDALLASWSPSD